MADIIKDSFSELNGHTKVLYQRGKVVCDFELNEMQDILRVLQYRALSDGLAYGLNPGSNDDGYKIVGTGAENSVTVKAGTLFVNGIPLRLAQDTTFSGFTTPGGSDRTDTVYLAVTEVEVADPAMLPQLGETTRRRKLIATIGVAENTTDVPASSSAPIWQGGTHYFKLATISRTSGNAEINADDVVDERKRLPPYTMSQIVKQTGAVDNPTITGVWTATVGDGVTSFGDFNTEGGVNGIRRALNYFAEAPFGGSVKTIVLHVKSGSYEVTDDTNNIVYPAGVDLRLVGAGRSGDNGTVIINDSDGAVPTFDISNGSSYAGLVTVEDMLIMPSNTNTSKHVAFGWTGDTPPDAAKSVRLKNVYVLGSIVARNTHRDFAPKIYAENSAIRYLDTSDPDGEGLLKLEIVGEEEYYNPLCPAIIVKNSFLITTANQPLLDIEISDSFSSKQRVGPIHFDGCQIKLGGQDGDYLAGAVRCTSDVTNVVFEDISFIDCRVRSENVLGFAAGSTPLMHFVLMNVTGEDVYAVEKFVIKGGSWLCRGGEDSTLLPFYIGRETYPRTEASPAVKDLIVEDVEFGWDGYSTDACVYGAFPSAISDTPDSGRGAAFTFSADRVKMRNIRFVGCTARSTEGDLAVYANNLDVRNIHFERPYRSNNATGSYPCHRVILGYPSNSARARQANIEGLEFRHVGSAESLFDGSKRLLTHGYMDAMICTDHLDEAYSLVGGVAKARIAKCVVTGITFPTDVAGHIFCAYDTKFSSADRQLNLTIEDNTLTGIAYTPIAFTFADGDVTSMDFALQRNRIYGISDVTLSNSACGIIVRCVDVTSQRINVLIDKNTINYVSKDCIWVQGGTQVIHGIEITGNMLGLAGRDTSSGKAIRYGYASGSVTNLYGLIMNNVGRDQNTDEDRIRFELASGGTGDIHVRGISAAALIVQGSFGAGSATYLNMLCYEDNG